MNFLFIYLLFLLHPFYVSTSEIFLNEDRHEVKIKIFRDDLEDGLRVFHGNSISIDSDRKLAVASEEIDEYIKNQFQLSIDKYEIYISMIRYKLINDLVEISFYFNYAEEINKITIVNNILFDVYKVQKNVVLINYKSKINSYIFSFSDREKTFIY